MKNTLVKWHPIESTLGQVFFETLTVSNELCMWFVDSNTGSRIQVTFEFYISYRSADEGYLLQLWMEHKPLLGNFFYIIDHSTYLEQLKELSLGMQPALDSAIHYGFFSQDECVEVLSTVPPSIQVFDRS